MTQESFEFWRDSPHTWKVYAKVLANSVFFQKPPITSREKAWAWFADKLGVTEDELNRLEAYHGPWD